MLNRGEAEPTWTRRAPQRPSDPSRQKRVAPALAALVAGGVLAAPSLATATTTRVYTLGGMNRFIVDDTNRWLYPHTITKYGNLFYVELFGAEPSQNFSAPGSLRQGAVPAAPIPGSFHNLDLADVSPVQQTAGGGAILALTSDLFLGMHLSDYQNATVPTFLGLLAGSSQGDPRAFPWLSTPPGAPSEANRKFDLFLAYNLQDVAQLGLKLTYGSSKYNRIPNDNDPDVDSPPGVEKRRVDDIGTQEFGFLLGGGLELGDAAALDIGFGMNFHSLTYAPNDRRNLLEGGGGLEVQGDVRAMIGISESWELIPAVSFRYMGMSAADLANYGTGLTYTGGDFRQESFFITDVTWSRMLFDAGLGGHFRASDAVHFWGAVGFQFMRNVAQYENKIGDGGTSRDQNLEFARDTLTTDALPYMRLAIEARIFSWLDFRGGVVKYLRADTLIERKDDDDNPDNNRFNEVTRDHPFFDYFVGFAVHHEGFFADVQIDPNWFMRGPNFLSGAGANMFVNASLGYRF